MYCFFSLWLSHPAFRILVLQAGIKPGLSEVEAQSPNHWETKEVPFIYVLEVIYVFCISLVKKLYCGVILHISPKFTFSEMIMILSNEQWQKCLYHGNQQALQTWAFFLKEANPLLNIHHSPS